MPIPCFVNRLSSSAGEVLKALEDSHRFELRHVLPEELEEELRAAVARGVKRVLVAGGDGTVAAAAGVLAGTGVELALLPAGTLNHFAREHGIPADPEIAAAVASGGRTTTVDIAVVNGRAFVNTSSIGAYVLYVRTRERFEPRVGYRLASAIAALTIFARLPTFQVELEVEGEMRRYRTPLLFVGVGERELRAPKLGARKEDGQRGLHVMVVRGRTRARVVALMLAAVARGTPARASTVHLDTVITHQLRVELRRRSGSVAVDGEIVRMEAPLEYRLERDALTIVVPADQRER